MSAPSAVTPLMGALQGEQPWRKYLCGLGGTNCKSTQVLYDISQTNRSGFHRKARDGTGSSYTGQQKTFKKADANLVGTNFQDTITSVIVESGAWVAYRDINYQGP
ncbi:uncharacterized protein [Argopecten irradians]|uniref:uncharacterized protein n=1 Tax=Argopecten irradians TaxID=31199 RepID=UPI00371464E6